MLGMRAREEVLGKLKFAPRIMESSRKEHFCEIREGFAHEII